MKCFKKYLKNIPTEELMKYSMFNEGFERGKKWKKKNLRS